MLPLLLTVACGGDEPPPLTMAEARPELHQPAPEPQAPAPAASANELVRAALARTDVEVEYDPSYFSLDYPGGDVPANKGTCTDVVIRSYRALGFDLQLLVHEDMEKDFGAYPDHWGLSSPDSNIDHRRVPNLQKFFARHGEKLARSKKASEYQPGDLVTWNVGRNGKHVDHIGIVTNTLADGEERYAIVHNIGEGPVLEDVLFKWPITGHFRYLPKRS